MPKGKCLKIVYIHIVISGNDHGWVKKSILLTLKVEFLAGRAMGQ